MRFPELEPRLIRCTYGKWLAVSPPRAKVGIGVMGDTETEAWRNWKTAARQWEETMSLPPAIDISGLRDDSANERLRPRKRRHRVFTARRQMWAALPRIHRRVVPGAGPEEPEHP